MADQPQTVEAAEPTTQSGSSDFPTLPAAADDAFGREILLGETGGWRWGRSVFRRMPSSPRCKLCASPFAGPGGLVMRHVGKEPYPKNPKYCSACFKTMKDHNAGAEIPCSLLFADVRGSTTIAETMRPAAFRQLMEGFFAVASDILVRRDGVVDKFVGDEVVGLFIPALARDGHARQAIEAGRELIAATVSGHLRGLPIGVGVHTGTAFVGIVGGEHADFTAMGDPVNVTARLASVAGAGELLVTLDAAMAADWPTAGLERRHLDLKGKTSATDVVVIRAGAGAIAAG
jgi:adenylate cyclase